MESKQKLGFYLTFIYPGKQIKNKILIFKCSLKGKREGSAKSENKVIYILHFYKNI